MGPGLDMARRANLLVTEVFDTELIGEAAIATFNHAHKNLLTEDCLVVPTHGTVFAQGGNCIMGSPRHQGGEVNLGSPHHTVARFLLYTTFTPWFSDMCQHWIPASLSVAEFHPSVVSFTPRW